MCHEDLDDCETDGAASQYKDRSVFCSDFEEGRGCYGMPGDGEGFDEGYIIWSGLFITLVRAIVLPPVSSSTLSGSGSTASQGTATASLKPPPPPEKVSRLMPQLPHACRQLTTQTNEPTIGTSILHPIPTSPTTLTINGRLNRTFLALLECVRIRHIRPYFQHRATEFMAHANRNGFSGHCMRFQWRKTTTTVISDCKPKD